MAASPAFIAGAVEGLLDEAILRRLIVYVGGTVGAIYGKQGKARLLGTVRAYRQAARVSPWVILLDLDHDAECAAAFCVRHLPSPEPRLCFRVAVRAVEAWLLADAERLSRLLGVGISRFPRNPDMEDDPKRTIVHLARGSRRVTVRAEMVPRPESGRQVGPAYTSRLIEFVADGERGWRPNVAARSSDSLRSCIRCLDNLVKSSL